MERTREKRRRRREELKEGVQMRTLSSKHPAASAKLLPWKRYKSGVTQVDMHSCTYAFTHKFMTCKCRHPKKLMNGR